MPFRFSALPAADVANVRAGGPDANGLPAERTVSDGGGNPCRHCLDDIPQGRPMLVLAWRPFPALRPYAEIGPIFLCADCARRADAATPPPIVASRPRFMIRGYGPDERIAYGTGRMVETSALRDVC